jgi:hypothetical protein
MGAHGGWRGSAKGKGIMPIDAMLEQLDRQEEDFQVFIVDEAEQEI